MNLCSYCIHHSYIFKAISEKCSGRELADLCGVRTDKGIKDIIQENNCSVSSEYIPDD
jgi:hypothetical protein